MFLRRLPENPKTIYGLAVVLKRVFMRLLVHNFITVVFEVQSAYHQMPIKEADSPKTALSPAKDKCVPKCLPFGDSLQHSLVIRLPYGCRLGSSRSARSSLLTHIGDILLCCSNTWTQRFHLIEETFKPLLAAVLTLKPSKAQFIGIAED